MTSVKTLTVNSYAKLNLYLKVLKPRPDDYHDIKTIFEKIDLCDKVILKPRPDKKIKLTCNSSAIPKGPSNLAYRSARLLRETLHINKGADIHIIKNIPVSAGLGGGSSNAASVLLGLNKLWGLNLSKNKLAQLAANIGSDVPFFIYDYAFAEGRGRGDKIKPLKAISGLRLWHILVVPKFRVSTPLIYKKWDKALEKNKKAGLTSPRQGVKIVTLALKTRSFALLRESLFNSLEQVTARLYPQIWRIKEKLLHKGVESILMSGSGPAVFGICSSKKEALFLCRQLRKDSAVRVFATRTQ